MLVPFLRPSPRALVPVPLEFESVRHFCDLIANNLLAEFWHLIQEGPRGPSWMRCQNSANRLFAMRSQKCRTDSNSSGTGTSARGEGRRNGTSIASLCSAVSWYDDAIEGPRPPPFPRPGPNPTPRAPGCLPRPARPRPYPGASNRPIARVPPNGREGGGDG